MLDCPWVKVNIPMLTLPGPRCYDNVMRP